MANTMKTAVIYMPVSPDANEYWIVVREALEEAGVQDIRPAPMPSLAYVPRQLRAPVLLSSAEV